MAENAAKKINNVMDVRVDQNGQPVKGLVVYDKLSNQATVRFTPYEFKSFGNIMRITNQQLSIIIREYYQKIFHDLRGVYVGYMAGQKSPFNIDFYFTKNMAEMPEGKIANIKDLGAVDVNSNLYMKMQARNNRMAGNIYTLNDDTKHLLSEIMYGGPNDKANGPKSNRWKQCMIEKWVQSNDFTYRQGAGELWIRVYGCFDIQRILQKIMPSTMVTNVKVTKNSDGTYDAENFTANCRYKARFVEWLTQNVFVLNIEQFDEKAVAEFQMAKNPQMNLANGFLYY